MAQRKPKIDQALNTPQNQEDLNRFIARIGELQREIELQQLALNDQIETEKKKVAEAVAPLDKEIDQLVKGVYLYAELNRRTLTDEYKLLTVPLANGSIGWRNNPPSIDVEDEEAAIAQLEAMGHPELVRTKKSLNKDALLEKPDIVARLSGAKIKAGTEDFLLKPNQTKISFAKGPRKVKRETAQ